MTTMAAKYQFVHIESYGRTAGKLRSGNGHRSAADVIDEMIREPHASPHVRNPQPPSILEGDPLRALELAIDMAESARDALGRKRRNDAHIIAVCVCAYPVPNSELVGPEAIYELDRWIKSTLDWARQEFGADELKAAVLHRDEGYPHLHLVVVPPAIGVEPSPLRRAAKKALADAKGKERPRRIERNAFKQAGRDLQNSFYRDVSCYFGHQRIGMKRRKRMSPEQRQLEVTQARALLETQRKAEMLEQHTRAKLQHQEQAANRQLIHDRYEFEAEKSAFRKAQAVWKEKALAWVERTSRREEELRKKAVVLGGRMKPIIERLLTDAITRAPAATRRWLEPIIADAKRKLGSLLETGSWVERADESTSATAFTQTQGWSIPRR